MIRLPKPQYLAASILLILSSAAAFAQSPGPAPTPSPTPAPPHLVGSIAGHPGWPVAKPADVSSPEAILNACYSVISGPQGQPRDWDRMRSLFIPRRPPHPHCPLHRPRRRRRPHHRRLHRPRLRPHGHHGLLRNLRPQRDRALRQHRTGLEHLRIPPRPHRRHPPSSAASTASSCSRTATATGSSTSSGTRKPPTTPSPRSTYPPAHTNPTSPRAGCPIHTRFCG